MMLSTPRICRSQAIESEVRLTSCNGEPGQEGGPQLWVPPKRGTPSLGMAGGGSPCTVQAGRQFRRGEARCWGMMSGQASGKG